MAAHNWIDLAQDADTGIETLRAHFEGHAYDPHWHDSYLVGVTEQGVQQFNCRRARHQSTPGKVFLLEPGDIHDGEAPTVDGFTYRMLYLDPQWLQRELSAVFDNAPDNSQLSFAKTLATDIRLANATSQAFQALHQGELKIVRQTALDGLLERLTTHLHWRARYGEDPRFQGCLRHGTPRVPGAIAPGHGEANAGPWRTTGGGGDGTGVCRSEPSGALVCTGLWPDASVVSQALLKSSRQLIAGL